MNLNDVFSNTAVSEGSSSSENKFVKFDYKTQFIRFRFLEEMDSLNSNTQVSHWVNGVGLVNCNLTPIYDKVKGTIFLWDGWGKDKNTGVRINKKPEHNCLFCAETRKAKEDAGGNMDEIIKANNLHRRTQQYIANVAYEVLEKKAGQKRPTVVKELDTGLLRVRINDLFSDKGKGEYKTISNFNEIKGTITEHWFTMNGEMRITPDDSLTSEEKSQEFDRLEFRRPMPYVEGLKLFREKTNTVNMAEPLAEDDIAF